MEFDWSFTQNEENYNIVDNAAAICAGVAGYEVSKSFMFRNNPYIGVFVETGMRIIAGFIGLKIAEAVRNKSRDIRIKIKKKDGEV